MTNKTSFLVAMFTLLVAVVMAKLQAMVEKRVPMGYEDENGFHFGPEPVRASAGEHATTV